jgi:phage shock protein C
MKKLYRSRKDKVLFGVCGGIGEYFDVDPILIRIIFILLVFVKGFGFLLYFISAFLIPFKTGKQKSLSMTTEKAQSLFDELAKKS